MSEPSTPVTDHTSTAPPDGGPATRSGRRRIATFDDYPAAELAVERLTSHGFPVQRAAIVGRDLRSVEQIVGRLTVVTALWRGALSGAVPGALIGWIFGLFAWIDPLIGGLLLPPGPTKSMCPGRSGVAPSVLPVPGPESAATASAIPRCRSGVIMQ